ncbi:peptidase T [Cellulosilyticum sp. WCF-2]|uniref:peptidase T n=1 Tax=Cellulosilyticum sp. WCF-2 TaxID=2497860 RepID=UPI000F8E7FD9|nr:peptidase T [Cellulosilyticum sp. WCF-2]QEH70329.1 peptidase T [Cellulosilyticum sp. WCF-2]
MQEKLINRFLKYVQIDTMSDDTSTTFPSTKTQLEFAKMLLEECKALGLQDVSLDEYGYVMATLPSNVTYDTDIVGFIAHMDTVPDYSGKNVKPHVVKDYKGGDLILNAQTGVTLSPTQFPILNDFIGETLITTDGTTVLGGDDKAGIAEILTAIEYLINHPEIPHGTIRIGFTPDEEIGKGVDYFDVKKFNAHFAYTIDGGLVGELQCENFNAASATVSFEGISVHPGDAKGKMKNSLAIACEYQSLLPADEVPELTEGHEGFYHLHDMKGTLEHTELHYIIRDHDKTKFEARKAMMLSLADQLNQKYGKDTIQVTLKDSYFNMKEIIDQHPRVMALAEKAIQNVGVTPLHEPIRGGTDGARLSFNGLPCPNIFTGAYNYHGKYEFTVVNHMLLATKTIIELSKLVAQA